MAETYLEANTIIKMKPLNAIKTLFNKVENELTDGELSEIGLVLIKALNRLENEEDEA